MKKKLLAVFILIVTASTLGLSICTARDVIVMYAIGLLDVGENARMLTADDFSKVLTDYDKFKDRVEKAPTLKELVRNGWTIVHVESLRGQEPYRGQYYLFIFQGGNR